MNAYHELRNLDAFIAQWKKPALGIFGGAKFSSKIDEINALAQSRRTSIALLPALINPIFKKMGFEIGKSFIDETTRNTDKSF